LYTRFKAEARKRGVVEFETLRMPDLSSEKTTRSILKQSMKANLNVLDTESTEEILKILLPKYPTSRAPAGTEGYDLHIWEKDVDKILETEVKMTSSPGYPWIMLGCTTNTDVYAKFYPELKFQFLKRLMCMFFIQPGSPEHNLDNNLCDYCKEFIKGEFHKIEKLEEDRSRIIDSVGLTDQLVHRLLFSPQDEMEAANWETCPSKPGFGLNTFDQIEKIVASVETDDVAVDDIRHYDWVQNQYTFHVDGTCRINLARDSEGGQVEHVYVNGIKRATAFNVLVRRAMAIILNLIMVTSDGMTWVPKFPFKQKSGGKITASTNSRIKVYLVFRVCLWLGLDLKTAWAIAMGDDGLGKYMEGAEQAYKELGFDLKYYRKQSKSNFEFCSHRFVNGVATMSSPFKVWANFVNQKKITNLMLCVFINQNKHDKEMLKILLESLSAALQGVGSTTVS